MSMRPRHELVERLLFVVAAGWCAPPAVVGVAAFGVPLALALPTGVVVAIALTWWAARHLRPLLRPVLERLPALGLAACLVGLVADVNIARLSVFMHDPSYGSFATSAGDPWWREHCCLTAYTEGARFAALGDRNTYDPQLYARRYLGPLKVDAFHYPPPFLLLPGALGLMVGEFEDVRALWFAIQAIVYAAMLVVVAWWIGGRAGALALLAVPAILAMPHVPRTLQQGNVQITIVATSVVAMLLLWSNRVRSGGALLAFAVAGKIFPGLLLLYLAVARRWRALLATAGCMAVLVLLTFAAYGPRVLNDFAVYELPRILNGEAFPQAEIPRAVGVNQSMYGLTVKLRRLGVTALDRDTGRAIATMFGIVVVALTALVAWRIRVDPSRPEDRLRAVQVWVALVTLASLQGPFSGMNYALFGTIWLVTLLAAQASSASGYLSWLSLLVIYLVCSALLPSPGLDLNRVPPAWTIVTALVLQILSVAITFWAVWRVLAASREPVAAAQPSLAISSPSAQ
jgi:alpha-1,2-mannosyltransferase